MNHTQSIVALLAVALASVALPSVARAQDLAATRTLCNASRSLRVSADAGVGEDGGEITVVRDELQHLADERNLICFSFQKLRREMHLSGGKVTKAEVITARDDCERAKADEAALLAAIVAAERACRAAELTLSCEDGYGLATECSSLDGGTL